MSDPNLSKSAIIRLLREAERAGYAAASAATPTPMTVIERANPFDDSSPIVRQYEPVYGGVCGFGWVNIRPGNSRLANVVKARYTTHYTTPENQAGSAIGGYHKSYTGGIDLWVSGFNQSYERKVAYASAYAAVLSAAGFQNVYGTGRLD